MTTTASLKTLASNVKITSTFGAKLDWNKQDEWQQKANGYRCTLRYQRRQYSFDFWCGSGITTEPAAEDTLDCLLSDANAGSQDFHEFCSELGYDEDSRKAEKIHKACQKTAEAMKYLLGDDYETLLYSDRN